MCSDLWMRVQSWGNDLKSLPALSGTCRSPGLFQAGVEQTGSGTARVASLAEGRVHILSMFLPPRPSTGCAVGCVWFLSSFLCSCFSGFGISCSSNILKEKFGFFFPPLEPPVFNYFKIWRTNTAFKDMWLKNQIRIFGVFWNTCGWNLRPGPCQAAV